MFLKLKSAADNSRIYLDSNLIVSIQEKKAKEDVNTSAINPLYGIKPKETYFIIGLANGQIFYVHPIDYTESTNLEDVLCHTDD